MQKTQSGKVKNSSCNYILVKKTIVTMFRLKVFGTSPNCTLIK